MKCPKCGGEADAVGYNVYQIAVDDTVEVTIWLCPNDNYEWEA